MNPQEWSYAVVCNLYSLTTLPDAKCIFVVRIYKCLFPEIQRHVNTLVHIYYINMLFINQDSQHLIILLYSLKIISNVPQG